MFPPFAGSVSSDERKLAIDHNVTARSWSPVPPLPDLNVVAREGEDCVRRALEEVEASFASHADCRAEEANEKESFVDIMGSLERETGGESEGFTFTDILQRADMLSETLLEAVVDTPDLPLC